MSGLISALFGGGGNNNNAALQAQIADQQAQMVNEQGQQLKLISTDQAKSDQETADLSKPGIGRALLTYQKNTGGGATTLGGS